MAVNGTIDRHDALDPNKQIADIVITDMPVERKYIKNCEVQLEERDDCSFKVLASFNKSYILNIKEGREEGVDKLKRRQGLIFLREVTGKHFDLNLEITYKKASNIIYVWVVLNRKDTRKSISFADLTIHYFYGTSWKSESKKCSQLEKNLSMPYKYSFPILDIEKYVDDRNVFMQISVTLKSKALYSNTKKYCGLQNVGNTCYMNSFLQSLFFIKPLRKALFDINATGNDFMLAMQQVFAKMTAHDNSVVSPLEIIEASSWSRQFLFSQQDIHEFKLRVFDEIEKLNKDILKMFSVEAVSTVRCTDVDYVSETKITNLQIELNLVNHKKKAITNIRESLEFQCRQENLEGMVETEKYGKQAAIKSLKFTYLPSVLFLNLRRYQYQGQSMHKLFSKFQFQKNLDLTSFIGTQVSYKYTLYAVLVHRGRSADSGHYYSFINTSTQATFYDWYKFNDSIVNEAEQSEAIRDNFGGLQATFRFSRDTESFKEQTTSKLATAYILVYIRTQHFKEMQETVCSLPAWIVAKQANKIDVKVEDVDKVSVILVDDLFEKVEDVFNPPHAMLAKKIQFNMRQSIEAQYQNIKILFGNVEGTLWRISITNRNVTNLMRKFDNSALSSKAMLFGDNPDSPKQDFYILFVPNKHFTQIQDPAPLSFNNRLALVFIYRSWQEDDKYKVTLENTSVIITTQKNILLSILQSEHPDKILMRNGKVQDQTEITFKRKNMYCEIIRSFLKIDLNHHLKNIDR